MIDRSKFLPQFKAEARDHIQTLNLSLLQFEKNPDDQKQLEMMMRVAHTLKGAATMMGYKRIADIAHKMEDGLEDAMNGKLQLGKEQFDILLKGLDVITCLLEDKVTWRDKGIDGPFVDDLCQQMGKIFSGFVPAPFEPTTVASPSASAAPAPSSGPAEVPAETSVRVSLEQLDDVANASGELVIAKIRLKEVVQQFLARAEMLGRENPILAGLLHDLQNANDRIDSLTKSLESSVMQIRMMPLSYIFNTFPRAMRDLAHSHGKDVDFMMGGEETQLDKAIMDQIQEPLLHLLRNALDHGIEKPEDRALKGKPRRGKISLLARQEGSRVMITISDDGAGVDLEKVKEIAVRKKLVSREKVAEATMEQVHQFLFLAGFSTKEEASDISGRGVGLNIVRESVLRLKGMIELDSVPGQGTHFVVRLPVSLALRESLLVSAGSDIFAIPVDSIVETIRVSPDGIRSVETKEAIVVRDQILPLIRLNDVFGLPRKGIFEKKYMPVVVIQAVEKRIALLVDDLIGRQEIMSKILGEPLNNVQNIAGATILGDGRVVLILDVSALIESAENVVIKKHVLKTPVATKGKKKMILLAEDVMAKGMLEKNIL